MKAKFQESYFYASCCGFQYLEQQGFSLISADIMGGLQKAQAQSGRVIGVHSREGAKIVPSRSPTFGLVRILRFLPNFFFAFFIEFRLNRSPARQARGNIQVHILVHEFLDGGDGGIPLIHQCFQIINRPPKGAFIGGIQFGEFLNYALGRGQG